MTSDTHEPGNAAQARPRGPESASFGEQPFGPDAEPKLSPLNLDDLSMPDQVRAVLSGQAKAEPLNLGKRTHRALWVIGPPGIGKSTVFRLAVSHIPDTAERFWEDAAWSFVGKAGQRRGCPYISYPGGIEFGRVRPQFSGSDALPMDALRHAEDIVSALRPGVVVGEGDRLACNRFFMHLLAEDYELDLVTLTADPRLIEHRRNRGILAHPKRDQNPAWVRGRETKARNLTATFTALQSGIDGDVWPVRVVSIDTNRSPEVIADEIRQLPALLQLASDDFFGDNQP